MFCSGSLNITINFKIESYDEIQEYLFLSLYRDPAMKNNNTMASVADVVNDNKLIQDCLENAQLSILTDDGLSHGNDYTRCAAYQKYHLDIDWFDGKTFHISRS